MNFVTMIYELKKIWWITFLLLVLDKCQDEQRCIVRAASSQFGDDPCPSTSKYLEVAYKCRPNEFRSRVACVGEEMRIQCKKSQRIAVYSASYGRTETEDEQCPLPPGQQIFESCEADCAIGTVMGACHGKRRCRVRARREQFGDPCPDGVPPYLSIVYTCVPKRILKEIRQDIMYPHTFCPEDSTTQKNSGPPGGDQETNGATELIPEGGWNPGGITDQEGDILLPPFTRDYDIITPVTQHPSHSSESNKNGTDDGKKVTEVCITVVPGQTGETQSKDGKIGFVSDWINTVHFVKENKEKFILYALLSLCVGIILLLLVIIIRLVQTRRHIERRAKMDITDPIPSSSPPPPHDDFTSALLNGNHAHAQGDTSGEEGAEIISYSHNRGPPPFRSDTGNRSFNNYYG